MLKCFLFQALRARQLGVNTVVVLEQIEELPLALEAAARLRVRPALGVRSRLATHHKCATEGCKPQPALMARTGARQSAHACHAVVRMQSGAVGTKPGVSMQRQAAY
jgi:arginine decarboxylase-like protein